MWHRLQDQWYADKSAVVEDIEASQSTARKYFTIRVFWEHCHPGKLLKFISLDQKPSWFNNAGHKGTMGRKGGPQPGIKENFCQTRERYSILTLVRNFDNDDPDAPPPVEVLFRAARRGTTWTKLQTHRINSRPWMRVQCQECGSYRSVDVVQALSWMLPQANNSEESCVVLLDWFSGHLTT